jgi:exportin-2 (importin alpha re-exporter)
LLKYLPFFPLGLTPDFIPVQLFLKLYPEQLQKSSAVENFIQSVWQLVGSNGLPGIADDSVRLLELSHPFF